MLHVKWSKSHTRRNGEPVEEPRHGTLAVPAPNVGAYTPAAGYVGPDTFSYGGRGETARGRIAALRVTVLVTVVSASVRQP